MRRPYTDCRVGRPSRRLGDQRSRLSGFAGELLRTPGFEAFDWPSLDLARDHGPCRFDRGAEEAAAVGLDAARQRRASGRGLIASGRARAGLPWGCRARGGHVMGSRPGRENITVKRMQGLVGLRARPGGRAFATYTLATGSCGLLAGVIVGCLVGVVGLMVADTVRWCRSGPKRTALARDQRDLRGGGP